MLCLLPYILSNRDIDNSDTGGSVTKDKKLFYARDLCRKAKIAAPIVEPGCGAPGVDQFASLCYLMKTVSFRMRIYAFLYWRDLSEPQFVWKLLGACVYDSFRKVEQPICMLQHYFFLFQT